jgi:hypothetical protein
MMNQAFQKVASITLLSLILGSIVSVTATSSSSKAIASNGSIVYWPKVDVAVNPSKVIGENNLSLGFMVDWEWKPWVDSSARRELARNASFKLIRLFDFRPVGISPRLMPCTSWTAGTWDWTNVDMLVSKIYDIGAEPLVCLSHASSNTQANLPPGMPVDPTTGLPYPNDYAAYCREWVKHFKITGRPVRFYEIFNEPYAYFGWSPNMQKLGYFKDVWNACARAMRAENANVLLSFDFIMKQAVLNYWVTDGDDVDFLDFHKYDCWATSGEGYFNDADLLKRAEKERFETTDTYGVDDASQIWYSNRGKRLPVICSESNINSGWTDGTDPRIQTMVGATWTALVLRKAILKGLSYYTYYNFYSRSSIVKPSGGIGFGMIDFDNDKPWYPYYVHQMIGNSLAVGDNLIESSCSSDDLRCLAWMRNGTLNILLVCKVDQPRSVFLHGIIGQLNYSRIDNSIPWRTPRVQTGVIDSTDALLLAGYSVILLRLQT